MQLIESVSKILIRLWKEDNAWQKMFAVQGWDYSLADLEKMTPEVLKDKLLDDKIKINRKKKGFEDFTLEGKRMIEPGFPAKSLLYHALASPNVFYADDVGNVLQMFPTLYEIDVLENFIYSLNHFSIESIVKNEGEKNVVLAMFSYEYRQAINTTHKKHADFCFSRTGVARVGTAIRKYEANLRAFTTFLDLPESNGLRVSPARYAAFIAVRRDIQDTDLQVLPYMGNEEKSSDIKKKRGFWVPIHKLFPGTECLASKKKISLSFSVYHENTKLKRICEYINQVELRNLEKKPYTITENLVELYFPSDKGNNRTASVWISPVPHPLIEEAINDAGERITIWVPPDEGNAYFAELTLAEKNGARSAPEYVNVRRKLEANGEVINLNDSPNVSELVAQGNYQAIMHIDYTCDGWIQARCDEIPLQSLPAYSLITAPDFIPFTAQRELIEWSETEGKEKDYWALKPWALSDSRLLPNITLKNSPFSTDDKDNTIHTLTAIVGPLKSTIHSDIKQQQGLVTRRSSYLPDAAAGEFQPGWDITWDRTNDLMHLSAYGLGSPFLEDAKLCAALSTFWPAAAPDIARSYYMEGWPSVCPLLDEEIGQVGEKGWDGVPAPKRTQLNGKDWVQLTDFNHVDYVTQGLLGQFNIYKIGQIDINEYKDRIDTLWHVYHIIKALTSKAQWRVLSFRKIKNTDAKLIQDIGLSSANSFLSDVWSVTIYRKGKHQFSTDKQWIFEEITQENNFYIDNQHPRQIWRKKENAAWARVTA